MADVTIQLEKPIVSVHGPVSALTLREPRAKDFFALGDVNVLEQGPGGTLRIIERSDVISAYIEKCLAPEHVLLVGQVSLADAIKVKAALLSFFETAAATPLPNAANTSSQSGDGPLPSSAAT